ncbi:hypothetical protein PsYK624_111150 [Phanerochaete sordida]|uniref:F-box domain-containing protein n=1 Tax=Phanerochaete sordida TaxID=48140 RepID=A0A9P3GK05_9APHY|nr:hypothetical protein PsYK624_111150 [Phanerochaete sordida]
MATPHASSFGLLPNEIKIEFLRLLPCLDMVRYRQVDRATKTLIDSTPSLLYKLKLFLADQEATQLTSEQDIGRSMASLERRESLWKSYRPSSERELELSGDGMSFLGVSGNFMACSSAESLIFTQVRPRLYKGYPDQWQHNIGVDRSAKIAVCPEQNLVALTQLQREAIGSAIIGLTVSLTTLSTGEHHPAAACQTIVIELPLFDSADHKIAINGDLLALMIAGDGQLKQTELYVWDWRTSVLRLNAYNFSGGRAGPSGASSFEFLNDRLIMVPVMGSWDTLRGRDAALCIFDCMQAPPGRHAYFDIPRVVTFRLPSLAPGAFYDQIYSVADGLAGDPAQTSSLGSNSSFAPIPAWRVVGVQMMILHPTNSHLFRNSTFCLFVHAGTLANICAKVVPDEVLQWNSWAPHTRFLRTLGDESFWLGRNVSHKRILIPEIRPNSGVFPPLDVYIYDFPSPPALRHAVQTTDRQASPPWQYVTTPTSVDDRTIFRSPIVTNLPYRKVPSGYSRVLGLQLGPDESGEAHVYLTGDCLLLKKRNGPWRVADLS